MPTGLDQSVAACERYQTRLLLNAAHVKILVGGLHAWHFCPIFFVGQLVTKSVIRRCIYGHNHSLKTFNFIGG